MSILGRRKLDLFALCGNLTAALLQVIPFSLSVCHYDQELPTCSPICQRREGLHSSHKKLAPRAEVVNNNEDCPH